MITNFKLYERKKKDITDDILDKMLDDPNYKLSSDDKSILDKCKKPKTEISNKIKEMILRLKELENQMAEISKKFNKEGISREEFINIMREEYGKVSAEYFDIEDTLIDDYGLTDEDLENYKNIF
jgi:predicted transcriptional regulator